MPNRSTRDAALAYAANGYFIVPVSVEGKVLGAASKNPLRVGEWWLRWPDAQIGLDLGRSKMVVVEVSAADEERLIAAGALLPSTIVATAGDMRRYFYRCPDWKSSNPVVRSVAGSSLKIYGGNSVMVVPS